MAVSQAKKKPVKVAKPSVRFDTQEELDLVKRAAAAEKLSFNQFIVRSALRAARKSEQSAD